MHEGAEEEEEEDPEEADPGADPGADPVVVVLVDLGLRRGTARRAATSPQEAPTCKESILFCIHPVSKDNLQISLDTKG